MSSLFITFEGGEGAGKSTQIKALKDVLEANGAKVLLTREPGGSELAEHLRNIILSGQAKNGAIETEALLFAAARADHMQRTILPALERGEYVLCDRFIDSTRAYQGGADGLSDKNLDALEALSCGDRRPDLTFLIDVKPELGLARAKARSEISDRFEDEDLVFHKKVEARFLQLALNEPLRIVVVDGSQSINDIHQHIVKYLNTRFSLGLKTKTL